MYNFPTVCYSLYIGSLYRRMSINFGSSESASESEREESVRNRSLDTSGEESAKSRGLDSSSEEGGCGLNSTLDRSWSSSLRLLDSSGHGSPPEASFQGKKHRCTDLAFRILVQILLDHCSGSVGSVSFWASRIRISPLTRRKKIRENP
jgi:hypothetical protein